MIFIFDRIIIWCIYFIDANYYHIYRIYPNVLCKLIDVHCMFPGSFSIGLFPDLSKWNASILIINKYSIKYSMDNILDELLYYIPILLILLICIKAVMIGF